MRTNVDETPAGTLDADTSQRKLFSFFSRRLRSFVKPRNSLVTPSTLVSLIYVLYLPPIALTDVDKLHAGWAQHQQYLAHEAQIRDINSIPTHRIDRNLPVPFLDLPPQYDDIEGLDSNRKGIQPAPITSGSPMTLGLSSRRRPVSCSDLKFFSPSGGFYPDGYSDSEAEGGEDASGSGLTFSRVYGPPGLPEIMPIYASNVDRGFCSPTAPQNTNSLRQGYSGGAGSMRNRSTHTTLLSKARSTTSLRSSHYGFAYRPSPRLNVPSSELFIGTLGTSLRGNNQQLGPLGPGQNYADGRPAWV